ncbi:sensor histidine kinase [Novosphingobium sp. PP1Y]|uniref:sensor histidine kinase n=1 Tax=Novosphingobium sp. PP1Y TaxID=702113 RepID=UPI00020EF8E4|nr:sensor histidine kinase [Novosphingobium sp. PP1Y]CCA90756.1 two-component system, NarL family,nitrate/nitrite sensor histidine kinase NarQ [Novosphingobium sp. PP1Y]
MTGTGPGGLRGWSDEFDRGDVHLGAGLNASFLRALLQCFAHLVFLIGLVPSVSAQQIPGYSHRHWDAEEGSPSDVRAIAQTRDGFLWLGTANGLYRFDGLAFEKIEPKTFNKWRSNQITALAAAPDGALWVGYDFGGVGVVRNGELRDANTVSRPRGSVWSIMVSRDGDVWVSVNGENGAELRRRHRGQWRIYTAKDWLQPEPIQEVFQARDGTIWIAQFRSILRVPPGASRPEKIPEQVGFATSFAEDENGTLWLLSDKGLQRLTPPRLLRKIETDGPSSGGSGKWSLLFEDGLAWLGGDQQGIVRLSNLKGLAAGRDVIAAKSRILFRDREGTIWGGGPDGLVNYMRSPIVRVDLKGAPTTGFAIGSVAGAPVYVATDAGVYRLSDQSADLVQKTSYAITLCAGPRDQLLVPTLKKSYLKRDGRWTAVAGSPSPMALSDCSIDAEGEVWASGTGLFKLSGGAWNLQKGWPTGQSMLSDGKDGFYFNLPMHAFLHARPGSVRTLWKEEEIKIGFVHLIKKIGNHLYLGGEKGIARYDGKQFVSLESAHNPWLNGISGLAIDQKQAWLIGAEGIFLVPLRDFNRAFEMPTRPLAHQLIGSELGLTSRSFAYVSNDAVLDAKGNPWFVTNRGVVRVDPARIGRNPVLPPVNIRSLEANGHFYPQRDVTLPAGTTRLQFDFVALSLTKPTANAYRYKMEGVDDDWVDTGGKRQATYTGLRPGTYRFQVVAANSDGVWNNDGAVMTVTILPYFWQTWWFKTALLLIVAVLLWAFIQTRMRAAAQAARERIEDRIAVREHIAQDLHDTLLQGFQGLVLRFQSTVERLPPGHPAREELESTLDRADDVLQEGRDRVRFLREESEPVDLGIALTAIAEDVLQKQIKWSVKEAGTIRPVCAPVADDIARIANETMFNALRHAQANMITVRILHRRDSLLVCVADDGVGLDATVKEAGGKAGHYGLVGMRERAQRLGAIIKISDVEPSGTEIKLTLPARIAYR